MEPPQIPGRFNSKGGLEFSIVDGSSAQLHERIGEVPAKFMEAAATHKARREHWAEQERRSAERQRALAEKARLRDRELERLAKFEKMALDIERASRLRVLADALATPSPSAASQVDAATREWILNAANWLDPMVRQHWPTVDDANRL